MDHQDHERREAYFRALDNAQAKTQEMLLAPHDDLGLVLKCHLIAEDSLTNYLIVIKGLRNIQQARLTFSQKVALIDESDGLTYKSKGSLREINKIRNSFGHNFNAHLEIAPDGEIARSAKQFLEGASQAYKDVIEKFEELGGEAEQVKVLKELISGMLTEIPVDTQFTGHNLALLAQKKPQEVLANFVSSFCDMTAIEIHRRGYVPTTDD